MVSQAITPFSNLSGRDSDRASFDMIEIPDPASEPEDVPRL